MRGRARARFFTPLRDDPHIIALAFAAVCRQPAGRRWPSDNREAELDSNLFKTKSIEQLVGDVEHGAKSLKRSLSAFDLTLLGIGAIIGTGIFVLTGTAAANQAGPAIVMSYVAAGLGLRLRRALLRRVRVDDPDRRQRLHLRVCHARRVVGLDDRLGPDPRVRRRLDDRRDRMERLHAAAAARRRHRSAGLGARPPSARRLAPSSTFPRC